MEIRRAMRTTCLVNSYNYRGFIEEAVQSALDQTVPFDEIIVVDDGSTDGSLDLVRRRYGGHPRVRVLAKPNEGQLSCFNEGFAASTGELVFFLDADDAYRPDYLEQTLKVYRHDPVFDFVFCGRRLFGKAEREELLFDRDRDLGCSAIFTLYRREWVGASTSCLSMRRSVLGRFLPLPHLEDWRTRADDCLIFGASLAGARRFYLAQPLVRYRVHDDNCYYGRARDPLADYQYALAVNRLFGHLVKRLDYDPSQLPDLAHREFRTIPQPTYRQLRHYAKIVLRSSYRLGRKLKIIAAMVRQYRRGAHGEIAQPAAAAVPLGAEAPRNARPAPQEKAA